MKKLYFLLFLTTQVNFAQLSLPYATNFNSPVSDEGWSHYAVSGTDDWGRGVATGTINTSDFSWATKLLGTPTINSNMVLESPAYDLTNANLPYVLSFKYKSSINSGNLYLEYSIDNGTTWTLLNPTTTFKKNWQSTSGFVINAATTIKPALNLSFLQGNANVKFRFRLKTNSSVTGYGWIVDDFSLAPESYNVYASSAAPVEISPLCPQITVKTSMQFDNQYTATFLLETKYYLSTDTILDANDTLLGSQSTNTSGSLSTYNITLTTPPNLQAGQYYIVYRHDSLNNVTEINENDNVGYCSVLVKPIFTLPYANDFEQDDVYWKPGQAESATTEMMWERGLGRRHHIEKSHSGVNAWHTSKTIMEHPEYTFQWVESPYFNLTSATGSLVLSFWYKCNYPNGPDYYDNVYKVQYSSNCSDTWNDLYIIPNNNSEDWESISIPLSSTISSNTTIRFRITYHSAYVDPEGIIFDDFYLGPQKTDLSIEQVYSNKRFTSSNSQPDILKYQIRNAGSALAQTAVTKFYWSNDSQLDGTDVLLGEQPISSLPADNTGVWMTFNYTKPTQAPGDYFLIYVLDATNQVDELRESNNTGSIPIQQLPTYNFPYYNDFELNADNWTHEATLGHDDWEYGVPHGDILNAAFSGNKALISSANTTGEVTSMSRMHYYTPAFNLSTSQNPVLEFDMKLNNYGGCSCFELTSNLSYSIDNGATWVVLEPVNTSYSKWYKTMKYDEYSGLDVDYGVNYTEKMFAFRESAFSNYTHYNSRDIDRNTKYMINIPQLKNETNVRFRFNLSTLMNDGTSANLAALEGALIDNFQIREAEIDLNVPYTKNLYLSSLAKKLHFSIDVKNSGNYISNASDIKFYLSNDTAYNSGDYYLGSSALAAIRPDFKSNKIIDFNLPTNLTDYHYLVYVIDDSNANAETNETNNQGFWDLGLTGVAVFPYSENFEGDVINGWKGYCYTDFGSTYLENYRVTNKIAVSETNNFYKREYNGVLRTERIPYGSWQDYLTTLFYIESPAFNFTTYNSTEPLVMTFDVMSVGKNFTNGGNMQYSIDGGLTWILLTTASAPTQNWYPNYNTMSEISSQPGWFGYEGTIIPAKMDISFLKTQSNVIFRFKYFSNYASAESNPRGMRIDNFTVGQETMVADINCFENIPYQMNFENFENSCWEMGANDDEILLLDRAAQDIHWQTAANFANINNNASAKIDLINQGNTNGVWMISPKFNMVSGNKLAFNIALTQYNSLNVVSLDSDDTIKLMYTDDNGATWNDLKVWSSSTAISNTGQLQLINSIPTSGVVRFAFWATNGTLNGNTDSTFYVDDFQVYTGTLGVNQHNGLSISYFPNPVKNFLNITSPSEEISHIDLHTVSGQLLESFPVKNTSAKLDLSSYPDGVYFVKVYSEDKSKTIKILK